MFLHHQIVALFIEKIKCFRKVFVTLSKLIDTNDMVSHVFLKLLRSHVTFEIF